MKSLFLVGLVLLLSGCATNSDISKLQSQIDGLDSKVSGEYVELTSKIQDVRSEEHTSELQSH